MQIRHLGLLTLLKMPNNAPARARTPKNVTNKWPGMREMQYSWPFLDSEPFGESYTFTAVTFGEAFGESYISLAASLEIRILACFGILEVFDDAQHVDVCF